MQRKIHGQMSESFLIAGILSISGGLQDAYTYMYRGKVICQCTDRQYRAAGTESGRQELAGGTSLFFSITVLRIGSGNGRMHPYEIPEGTEDPLETAGTCDRNTFVVCSRFFTE